MNDDDDVDSSIIYVAVAVVSVNHGDKKVIRVFSNKSHVMSCIFHINSQVKLQMSCKSKNRALSWDLSLIFEESVCSM